MIRQDRNGWSALAVALVAALWASSAAATNEAALVTRLDGTATVSAKGAHKSTALKKNDSVYREQVIKVGDRSRIELKFPDGTVMRFAERSTVNMTEIAYNGATDSKKVRVALGGGKIWANVKKLTTQDSKVEVSTVNAVAGVRGTVYRVNVAEDNSATVKVYDGSVAVSSLPKEAATGQPGGFQAPVPVAGPQQVPPPYHEVSMEEWTVIVKAMQQITISPQGAASAPQDFTAQQDMDDWVAWNQERDAQLQR